MGEPAIRKVQLALKTLVEDIGLDAVVLVDLSTDEAIEATQGQVIVIRMVTDEMSRDAEQAQMIHTVTVHYECLSRTPATGSIDAANQVLVAAIYRAGMADRSLGGRLEDTEFNLSDGTEAAAPDVGSAILRSVLTYYTPLDNIEDIVGVGGVIF